MNKIEIFIWNCLIALCWLAVWAMAVWVVLPTLAQTPDPDPEAYTVERFAVVQEEYEAPAEAEEAKEVKTPDPAEVELIGRTIWGEADGVTGRTERAAVAWCILNRVDAWGQTVEEVVTAPNQFHGYRAEGTCPPRHLDLAADVLARWYAEKEGAEDVGRVLPADYLYFIGDGKHNHFSAEYQGTDFWTWTLDSPYTYIEESPAELIR